MEIPVWGMIIMDKLSPVSYLHAVMAHTFTYQSEQQELRTRLLRETHRVTVVKEHLRPRLRKVGSSPRDGQRSGLLVDCKPTAESCHSATAFQHEMP